MTAYINKLKDKTGNQQLPVTHERAVRDDNGTTAETKFQNLEGAMDKAYVASSDNGMGRITLKKNMVSGVNTLTQSMMQATNTIYVIQYDFTPGEDITVPANCILCFEGGSISASGNNDTITGQNTGIEAALVKIFSIDMALAGSWRNTIWEAAWFGAKGDGSTDNAQIINAALTIIPEVNTLHFGPGTFNVSTTIKCPFRQLELDYNATIKATASMNILIEWFGIGQVKAYTYRRPRINGGAFDGDNKAQIVIACYGLIEGVISNTRIFNGITDGIYSKYDDGTTPYDYDPHTFGYINIQNVTGQHLYSNSAVFLRLGSDDLVENSDSRDYHIGLIASDNVKAINVNSWISQVPDASTYIGSVAFRIDGHCELVGCTIDTYHIGVQFVGNHNGNLCASNLSWMNYKKISIEGAPVSYLFDGSQSSGLTNTIMISNLYFHSSENELQVLTQTANINTNDSYITYLGNGITGNNKLQLDNLKIIKNNLFSNNTNSTKYVRIGYSNASSVYAVDIISNNQRIMSKFCMSVFRGEITNAYIENSNPLGLLNIYFKQSSGDNFEVVLMVPAWSDAYWESPSNDLVDCTEINDISGYTSLDTKTYKNYGTRPTLSGSEPVGYIFFDTSLNPARPIWYKGNGTWVDATGATV